MTDHECLVLALDMGTSGVKAAVVDSSGRVSLVAERRQVTLSNGPGWREHVPARTLRAALASLREAAAGHDRADRICSISVTGSSGSFLMLDPADRPTTNIITWQDRRTAGAEPIPGFDLRRYREITGTTMDPSVALSRLLWLREHRPEVTGPGARLATPQGLVMMALGAPGISIEPSVAALVGLLDLESRDWSAELLERFDLESRILPPVIPSGSVVGQLGRRAAERLGLRPGIDLVLAATDGVCAQLGAGVVEEGQVYGYLGSALAVSGPIRRPLRDPDGHLTTAPGFGPGWWRLVGLGMAGASAIDWFARASGRPILRDVELALESTRPGSAGVLFLPSLAGAAAPSWDVHARGAFLGLTFSTSRQDLVRTVLEGVALELRAMFEAIRTAGIDASGLRLTGGGTRSLGWCRIVASAIHGEVSRVTEPHPGLRGAAFYAVAAHGADVRVESVAGANPPATGIIDRDPGAGRVYDELAETYLEARGALSRSSVDLRLARIAAEENTAQ